jgi:hypothetical protein
MTSSLKDKLSDSLFNVAQNSLVRLFLGLDYAVNIISGYSYRTGWHDSKENNGRVVTTFGHPLLNEARFYIYYCSAHLKQIESTRLKIRSIDADNVWMEPAANEASSIFTSGIISRLPNFLSKRLRPGTPFSAKNILNYVQFVSKCLNKPSNCSILLSLFRIVEIFVQSASSFSLTKPTFTTQTPSADS